MSKKDKYNNNKKLTSAKVSTDQLAYQHVFKSISLFGGVQVIQIITALIRGKFVAVLLGTTGMGIYGILVSSLTTIQTISGLGMAFSAVREISQAKETGNSFNISKTILVFLRWLLFSSLIGALSLVLLAPWLSVFAFGNSGYTNAFIWLAIVVAVNILISGFQTILQGTRRLNDLAKVSIIGSTISIIVAVPIYYLWGIDGIVPALILVALTSFTINIIFFKKIKLEKIRVGFKETIKEGHDMFKLGVARMIASLLGALSAFLINAYIKNFGSLSDVGLYQAGISITNQYVGIVFAAIALDFFPRLAAVKNDSDKIRNMVNQQSEITLLIVTPLLMTMMLTAPFLIKLLLADEFLSIVNFIKLVSVGVFFMAAKQSIDLIPFAKGDTQTFLLITIIGSSLLLFFTVVGYRLDGLNGIGIMFIIHSIICFIIVIYVAYKKYNYYMSKNLKTLIIFSIFPLFSVCLLLIFIPNLLGYITSSALLSFSIIYSVYRLEKLVGIREMYYSLRVRLTKKRV